MFIYILAATPASTNTVNYMNDDNGGGYQGLSEPRHAFNILSHYLMISLKLQRIMLMKIRRKKVIMMNKKVTC